MNPRIKVNKSQVGEIVSAVFPEYKGRKFWVVYAESVTLHDTNWGGGTRNFYRGLNRTGEIRSPFVPSPWVNPFEGAKIELTAEVLLVEHSIFCGKDLGVTIYAHPSLAEKLLTA